MLVAFSSCLCIRPQRRPNVMTTPDFSVDNGWPFRLALLLALVTFVLIWVGGLVTSYDAGMAVPDWPGTYGYNLFLYPWQTWITGPWDVFVEHGHRLLGALAGVLTILLVLAVFRWDQRVWVRHFSLGALAAVILQGCLGGFRVLLDDRQLAMLHGCAAPAFFALSVALCVVTSRTWKNPSSMLSAAARQVPRPPGTGAAAPDSMFSRVTLATTVAAYVQLVIGALVRHVPVPSSPSFIRLTLLAHLIVAGVVAALIGVAAWLVFRGRNRHPALRVPAGMLVALILCQLVLGCAAWVVNYDWPTWMPELPITARYTTIESRTSLRPVTVTAHAAMGSLVVAASILLTLRAYRLLRAKPVEIVASDRLMKGGAAETH